jgi:hypothetical protein
MDAGSISVEDIRAGSTLHKLLKGEKLGFFLELDYRKAIWSAN